MSVLSSPHFHDEAKAFEYLESIVWAAGVTCPHCGVVSGRVYDLSGVRGKPSAKSPEGALRHGLKKCGECRKQFTVKVGTVFEHARMPLHLMLHAVHLMVSSKKGISAHQLSRVLEVQYKSAWFLAHRIREAMKSGVAPPPMGGEGTMVEADETFIGRVPGNSRMAIHNMNKIGSLVDRATGRATSAVITGFLSSGTVGKVLHGNVSRNAQLMTDEGRHYGSIGRDYAAHYTVNHSVGEYVRKGDATIHTNTIEGFFSIFKRGMKGVYQHCGSQHLHRYLAKFDFRYIHRVANGFDDRQRAVEGLKGIVGKRLTYRRPDLNA